MSGHLKNPSPTVTWKSNGLLSRGAHPINLVVRDACCALQKNFLFFSTHLTQNASTSEENYFRNAGIGINSFLRPWGDRILFRYYISDSNSYCKDPPKRTYFCVSKNNNSKHKNVPNLVFLKPLHSTVLPNYCYVIIVADEPLLVKSWIRHKNICFE